MPRFLLTVLLPALAVSLTIILFGLERRRADAEAAAVALAESAAESFSRQVEIWRISMDAVLSGDAVHEDFDAEALFRMVTRVAERLGGWAVLTTRDDPAVMMFNTRRPGERSIRVARAVPEVLARMEDLEIGGPARLSDVFEGPVAGERVFVLVAIFRAADGVDYALSFAFGVDRLDAALERVAVSSESVVSLADGTLRIVGRSREADRFRLQPLPKPCAEDLARRRSGVHASAVAITSGAPAGMIAYAPIPGVDWGLVIEPPATFFALGVGEALLLYGTGPLALILFGGLDRARRLVADRREAERRLARESETAERLSDALTKAREAERARRETLGVLGHEIRTPILGAIAAVEMVRAEAVEEKNAERLRSARHGLDALLSLSDDMLDMARLDAKTFEIAHDPFDLVGLVRRAAEVMAPLARRKALALRLEVPDDVISVAGDPERLRQVLLNLLSNAIKYTPSGHVTLTLETRFRSDGRLDAVLSVADTGPGVPPEEAARLFEPFERGAEVHDAGIGGLGLGLAISRRIVERMQGRLSVEAGAEGGAVFRLRLTLDAAPAPRSEAASDVVAPAGRLRGLTLLLVEDHPLQAELLRAGLEAEGAEVRHAETGFRALDLAAERTPDVVLIDLGLPDMSGVDLARRLIDAAIPARRIAFSANPMSSTLSGVAEPFHAVVRKSGDLGSIVRLLRELSET